MRVMAAQAHESDVPVKTIKVGDGRCFRLPHLSFEEAIAADDGPHFWIVIGEQKDGLVTIIGIDGKGQRKIPEETLVIPHSYEVHIFPTA